MLAELDTKDIGITIVCLLFIIKMMWEGVMKLKSGKNGGLLDSERNFRRDMYAMKAQTSDLHEWHNKEDGDGRKIWYVKASFEESIKHNSDCVKENTAELKQLKDTIKALDN